MDIDVGQVVCRATLRGFIVRNAYNCIFVLNAECCIGNDLRKDNGMVIKIYLRDKNGINSLGRRTHQKR